MQTPREPQAKLAARIVAAMEHAGRLSEAVLDFIDTTLFPVEADRLALFLKSDAAGSERDSLLDLIFSPDLAVQIDLEPLIRDARLGPGDVATLSERILDRPIQVQIRLPDGHSLGRIRLPDFIKSQYLARLNLSFRPAPQLDAALDRELSASMATVVRVRLRNARLSPSETQQPLLERFFERMPESDPDFLICLERLLSLLPSAGQSDDFFEVLAAQKRLLYRHLQQVRRFETQLRHANMETLMLQGVPSPQASQEELLAQMRHIDLICQAIFGRVEAIAAPLDTPLRHVSDADTPEAAVQALLRDL